MNKKILIPIIGLSLAAIGFAVAYPSYSQGETCQQQYLGEMSLMRSAWENQINAITLQEEPASEMIDDAFESVRTYRCWLEYLCLTVQYSGKADPRESASGITSKHIETIPGCAATEDVIIPGTRLKYLERCAIAKSSAITISDIQADFNNCQKFIDLNFGVPVEGVPQSVMFSALQNQSTVYISLESKLKTTNANQRARAVEDKLFTILNKMRGMENQVAYLKNFLFKLYDLLPCYLNQCD